MKVLKCFLRALFFVASSRIVHCFVFDVSNTVTLTPNSGPQQHKSHFGYSLGNSFINDVTWDKIYLIWINAFKERLTPFDCWTVKPPL